MYGSLIFNVLYEKQFGAIDNFDAINIDFVDWNEYRRLLCVDDGWRWKHIPYHIASVKISISRYTRSSDQKNKEKKDTLEFMILKSDTDMILWQPWEIWLIMRFTLLLMCTYGYFRSLSGNRTIEFFRTWVEVSVTLWKKIWICVFLWASSSNNFQDKHFC